jgi:hypothetical protein
MIPTWLPTCASYAFILIVICLVIVLRMLITAGPGYEDEHGFHEGWQE